VRWCHNTTTEEGFVVLRRRVGGPWAEVARLPAQARSYESTGVLASEMVEHCVRSFTAVDTSDRVISRPATTLSHSTEALGGIIAPRSTANPRCGEGSVAADGSHLLYVYGRYEGSGDYARAVLAARRSVDSGLTWSDEETVLESEHQLALPSILSVGEQTLLLSYVSIMADGSAKRVIRRSSDFGRSWSAESDITDGIAPYMTGSHDRLRQLASGRLVYPVHTFLPMGELATFVYISDDTGRTWRRTTDLPLRVPGTISPNSFQLGFWEAAVAECGAGQILMVGRTAMGRLYRSMSYDDGISWSQPEPMNVQAPTPPANLLSLDTETILLVWNPHVDVS